MGIEEIIIIMEVQRKIYKHKLITKIDEQIAEQIREIEEFSGPESEHDRLSHIAEGLTRAKDTVLSILL